MTAGSGPGSADGVSSDASWPAHPSLRPRRTAASSIVLSSAYSRFVQRLRRRYAQELALLPPGEPLRSHMTTAYAALQAQGSPPADALRIVRIQPADLSAPRPTEQIPIKDIS